MSAEIDALMRAYDGAVPGASVAVLRDGETEVRRSYGLADLDCSASPQPPADQLPAGISLTKQFTAAAVLLLAG